ncbi:MAG: glycosyl transferase [Lachnospiraceae bacterium]|nr:glycosyl transferase [Lachnospiraceae bacterium]MCI9487352.1 glycosyl transferase [Lachnospiraceae bacterium]
MKALILSCNTGQGHNAAGKALKEEFLRRGAECKMLDALRFARPKTSGRASGVYVKTATNFPDVFGAAYKVAGKISSSRRKSPVYYANTLYGRKLYRYIEKGGYDCVVMPHLFPAEAITYIRKHYPLKAACFFVATDYTCIPFTEETGLDAYFIPSDELVAEYVERGIPEERLVPLGIPVSDRFGEKKDKQETRLGLGIGTDGPVVLVMTGSMGFGNVCAMASVIEAGLPEDGRVVILGGNNQKLKEKLRKEFRGNRKVMVLDFTTQADLYMDICDVLVTKPGGLTSTEAAAKGIPMVHSAPIPGCETRNAAFFSGHGMSVLGQDEREAGARALELLKNKAAARNMTAAQKHYVNAGAAVDICDYIEEYCGRMAAGR